MITGYNTDVRHGEVVLHVQTEDKGTTNPFIESVIYVGGQVLVARRASYAALLADGKGEKEIGAMMEHQHRTMIAAIRGGGCDEKLGRVAGPMGGARGTREAPAAAETAAAASALAEVAAPAESAPTLDQVILEYLSTEAENEQLVLVLEGQESLSPGTRNQVKLHASSSKSGRPVSGAQVTVKMLSTVTDPRTLIAGATDDDGSLDLVLDIPQLDRGGSAALIISASSDLGRAEIKHLL